jgi:hypothetical protein
MWARSCENSVMRGARRHGMRRGSPTLLKIRSYFKM